MRCALIINHLLQQTPSLKLTDPLATMPTTLPPRLPFYLFRAMEKTNFDYMRLKIEWKYGTPPRVQDRWKGLSLPLDLSCFRQLEKAVSGAKKPLLQAQIPLIRLPAEMRVQIYEYVIYGKVWRDDAYGISSWRWVYSGSSVEEKGGWWFVVCASVMRLLCLCRVAWVFIYSPIQFSSLIWRKWEVDPLNLQIHRLRPPDSTPCLPSSSATSIPFLLLLPPLHPPAFLDPVN